jgi:membrane-associated protease RseP (regulator of RpoE activity)
LLQSCWCRINLNKGRPQYEDKKKGWLTNMQPTACAAVYYRDRTDGVQQLTPQLAQRLGYGKNEKGLVVSKVEALSPAAEAGIRRGDVIKEINRKEVRNREDLRSIIEEISEKDSLLMLVKRGKNTFFAVLEG